MADILNLTQHPGSPEQGVTEPKDKQLVRQLLTFDDLPSKEEIKARANALADLASSEGAKAAMIGGAPYLMTSLEEALKERGIAPLYAFSHREVEEVTAPDGSTKKMAVFRHLGFVEA